MTHRRGLPPFTHWATCAKCGAVDLHGTNYRGIRLIGGGADDEHLERRCRCCGYEWAQACLDAPAEKPKEAT